MNRLVLTLLLTLSCGSLAAATKVKLLPQVEPRSGQVAPGDKVTFSAHVVDPKTKKPIVGKTIRYRVMLNGVKKTASGELISSEAPVSFSLIAEKKAWYYVLFDAYDEDGTRCRVMNAADKNVGAVSNHQEFKSAIPEPKDFDEFWSRAVEELKTVPVREIAKTKVELTSVRQGLYAKFKGKFNIYDIKVDCVGGMPVSGYMTVPVDAKEKSLPAIVCYAGAGVRTSSAYFKEGAISLVINAHGIVNGKDKSFYKELEKGRLHAYAHKHKDNPEKSYFRAMFQRALRAVDYMMIQPEWNGKDLIINGASQAGAQATMVCALYSHYATLCIADYPAMCDHAGSLADSPRPAGWPKAYYIKDKSAPLSEKAKNIIHCMNYYDAVHFAKRIKCPFYSSTGYADLLTPPIGIYALINNVKPELVKGVSVHTRATHGGVRSYAGIHAIDRIIKAAKK